MKCLVVYSSKTGNTEKIARAIASAFEDCVVAPAANAPKADDFDQVFVGFWCDKGQIDDDAMAYLKAMPARSVNIFGTLGGEPQSELSQRFLQHAKESVPSHLQVNAIAQWQGKVDPRLIEIMSKMPGARPMTPERRARLDEAAKHPTEQDCAQAAQWARDVTTC